MPRSIVSSAIAALGIRAGGIDPALARGEDARAHGQSQIRVCGIFGSRPLLSFTVSITLFHFANAAMLPPLGERLSRGAQQASTLFMAGCIITAQVVMVPVAVLVGAKADPWGRKPLFLIGFAVLPVRGLLYTLWDDPYYLVSIQILDGIGAGIFGALFFIVVADLTRGAGHYNLAQGAASAAWGLGAALDNSVAGAIAQKAGFDAALLFLAGTAVLAFLTLLLGVPETKKASGEVETDTSPSPSQTLRVATRG